VAHTCGVVLGCDHDSEIEVLSTMKAQEKAQAMLSDDKVRKEREAHERADKEKQVVIREGLRLRWTKRLKVNTVPLLKMI
jgi:hypothetical protein